jgi:hypothetical protein
MTQPWWCCCEGRSPCACATTSYALDWAGGLTIGGLCSACANTSDPTKYAASAASPVSWTLAQRIACTWTQTQSVVSPMISCSGVNLGYTLELIGTMTLTKTATVFGPLAWRVFYEPRWVVAGVPKDNIIGFVAWYTLVDVDQDCPPTGVAFSLDYTNWAVSADKCWPGFGFGSLVRTLAHTAGTVTLS